MVGTVWAWWAAWHRAHLLLRPVQLVPGDRRYSWLLCQFLPPKDTSVFSNRPHQTCSLQSNTMDKSWREKSSLVYCSVRVKHSIENLQAATQEQNVGILSEYETSANLGNIRERMISLHAGTRPPWDQSSPQYHLHPCEEETRCMCPYWGYRTLCSSACPRHGNLEPATSYSVPVRLGMSDGGS